MLDINVETAGRSAFANEYPFRQLPDSSITSAPTLKYTNEDDATLATTLYTKTNEIVPSAVKPRPEYCGKDVSVASPVDLFKSKIRLTAKHGAFAEQLLAKTDSTYIDLTAHQFWQLVCDWFTLMGKRLANALRRSKQGKPPRHMHPSADEALLFVMCESEFLKDEYIGLTFDLRSYWEALERGLPPPELKPIQKDDERRESLNSDGLSQLYQFSPVADADVFDMMSNSKFDSGFSVPAGQRMFEDLAFELIVGLSTDTTLSAHLSPFVMNQYLFCGELNLVAFTRAHRDLCNRGLRTLLHASPALFGSILLTPERGISAHFEQRCCHFTDVYGGLAEVLHSRANSSASTGGTHVG